MEEKQPLSQHCEMPSHRRGLFLLCILCAIGVVAFFYVGLFVVQPGMVRFLLFCGMIFSTGAFGQVLGAILRPHFLAWRRKNQ